MDYISRSVMLIQLLLLTGAFLVQAQCPNDYECITNFGECRTNDNDFVYRCGAKMKKFCCPLPPDSSPPPPDNINLGGRLGGSHDSSSTTAKPSTSLFPDALLVHAECPTDNVCITNYGDCRTNDNGFVYRCGANKKKFCCPLPPDSSPPPPNNINLGGRLGGSDDSPSTTAKPSTSLFPDDVCGKEGIEARIIHGTEACIGQFPWMALLAFRLNATSDSEKKDYLCGGTLISNRYVLTAAHCVNNVRAGSPVSVRLGEHELDSDIDCTLTGDVCSDPPLDVDVEEVIEHEQYNTPFLQNDIALIRLKVRVNFTKYILPICLPYEYDVTEDEGRIYETAGWGRTNMTSDSGSTILMFTNMTGQSNHYCDDQLTDEIEPLSETQMCTVQGVSNGDVCKGDSGGPLMDSLIDSGGIHRTYQVGVVSFGSVTCGGKKVPSVFTRVAAYRDWMGRNMKP